MLQTTKESKLTEKLLSIGGKSVKLDKDDIDLDNIRRRSQLWVTNETKIKYMRGQPSQCHKNSCELFYLNKERNVYICTGYALFRDGIWSCHSWLVLRENQKETLIETTIKRVAYYGYRMTKKESMSFVRDNN